MNSGLTKNVIRMLTGKGWMTKKIESDELECPRASELSVKANNCTQGREARGYKRNSPGATGRDKEGGGAERGHRSLHLGRLKERP